MSSVIDYAKKNYPKGGWKIVFCNFEYKKDVYLFLFAAKKGEVRTLWYDDDHSISYSPNDAVFGCPVVFSGKLSIDHRSGMDTVFNNYHELFYIDKA